MHYSWREFKSKKFKLDVQNSNLYTFTLNLAAVPFSQDGGQASLSLGVSQVLYCGQVLCLLLLFYFCSVINAESFI